MPAGSQPVLSISANLGPIPTEFKHLLCRFPSQDFFPAQCWMCSIIHTLQQLKHQQGKEQNMYIIHICPPGRQAVRANEKLKLWSHGVLSEVNGMN